MTVGLFFIDPATCIRQGQSKACTNWGSRCACSSTFCLTQMSQVVVTKLALSLLRDRVKRLLIFGYGPYGQRLDLIVLSECAGILVLMSQ